MSNKMWGGRFAEVPPKFVEEFGAVIKVETRLCPYDIQAVSLMSRCWAKPAF